MNFFPSNKESCLTHLLLTRKRNYIHLWRIKRLVLLAQKKKRPLFSIMFSCTNLLVNFPHCNQAQSKQLSNSWQKAASMLWLGTSVTGTSRQSWLLAQSSHFAQFFFSQTLLSRYHHFPTTPSNRHYRRGHTDQTFGDGDGHVDSTKLSVPEWQAL